MKRFSQPEKRVKLADHAGFCFGVAAAVETAKRELEKASKSGEALYCLGELIHNSYVTDKLAAGGLITVQSVDEVPEGAAIIIRAHGEADSTYEKAKEMGIRIIDATCPFVSRIHKLARE
ncbi:MAG: 4-hydroxy-3-methylbut-2-enyl diphosphate reductase, partial [Firmicutes bacterium]|nr:4-hydroxy-3-methylbut-2-enyl diphosphate reductase [Bacillota bacterium]